MTEWYVSLDFESSVIIVYINRTNPYVLFSSSLNTCETDSSKNTLNVTFLAWNFIYSLKMIQNT